MRSQKVQKTMSVINNMDEKPIHMSQGGAAYGRFPCLKTLF